MDTRSTIALEYADGTVDQIYCHWDGYLSHNGQILLDHYQDPFKVQKLMDLGGLSILGEELGEKHGFDEPVEGVCTAYGRDRGETGGLVNSQRFWNFEMFTLSGNFQEYNYILRNVGGRATWFVSTDSQHSNWKELSKLLKTS